MSNIFRRKSSLLMFKFLFKNKMEDAFRGSHGRLAFHLHGLKGDEMEKGFNKYLSEIKYPPVQDFKKGLEWFNVSKPLSFKQDLKGKVVLLDFFTYCCINCMHILPDLKEIEEEFTVEDGLVVVGVHSAKFQNEKISSNILAAVQRYNIKHPVVNDSDMDMWENCGVSCWPSLVLLGPNSNPIVLLSGEGHKEKLKLFIKFALRHFKKLGQISDHKIEMKSVYHYLPEKRGPLLFPGKITNILKKDNEEIFAVSDSGNNRILILSKNGEILKQIGSSKAGFKDGSIDEAQFNSPQGVLFYDETKLFIADTENHAVRLVNLTKNVVETVAGDGSQSRSDYIGGMIGKTQQLSSPWDLALYKTEEGKECLVIAMAGTHQLWGLFFHDMVLWKKLKAVTGTCVAIAGTGREENRNNAYAHAAGFAQPSGLALCKKTSELFIADSESSTVRKISLVDGKVSPVVGGKENPYNLFGFGDVDGKLYHAKLQHALGVAMSKDESHVFVADTYNHKIKLVDIANNTVTTLEPPKNAEDKEGTFREPAGLCMSLTESKLYIADTNNHCIKVADIDTNNKITKIEILNLSASEGSKVPVKFQGEKVKTSPVSVSKSGGKLSINISVDLSGGLKLTENGVQNWEVVLPDVSYSCVPRSGENIKEVEFFLSVPPNPDFQDVICVIFDLMTCTEEACVPKKFAVEIPLKEAGDGKDYQNSFKVKVTMDSLEVA